MTDAEIDKLAGRQLDEAVALLDGWERVDRDGRTVWYRSPVPFLVSRPTPYSSDLCAAMSLLLDFDGISIEWRLDDVDFFYVNFNEPIHRGKKAGFPAEACRMFLKCVRLEQSGQAWRRPAVHGGGKK